MFTEVALVITAGTPVNEAGCSGEIVSTIHVVEVPIALTFPASSVCLTEIS